MSNQNPTQPDETKFGKAPTARAQNQSAVQQREQAEEAWRHEQTKVADANGREKAREEKEKREQSQSSDALSNLRISEREPGPQRENRDRKSSRDR